MVAALYAIAVFVLVTYGINLLWLVYGFMRHDRLEKGAPPQVGPFPSPPPIVTVQLPLYNERYVAERLVDACARLDYPPDLLEIQILDDSTDDTTDIVDELVRHWRANGLNVVLVRRNTRTGFKAGALQNGLATAKGRFIAIFDADFVPPEDFLHATLPHFQDPTVGMVQTRWVFLNRDWSLLTRLQAMGLEAHFAIEQFVRNRVGCFINFNGTAGIWRRTCIEDSGGWHADTLTEDLDLSYRAQLNGWHFVFLRETESPSELPIGMNAFRAQQFRWTKGTIQTAKKNIGGLLRRGPSTRVGLQGLIHLTNHMVFPFLLLAAILHAPVYSMMGTASGPGEWYFAMMGIGLVALSGVFLVQLATQQSLHADWLRRMTLFPLFLVGSCGLAINNTLAIADALSGRQSPFVRTPKRSSLRLNQREKWWENPYATRRLPRVVLVELIMAMYSAAGLVVLIATNQWIAVPFQAFITVSFGLVGIFNLVQVADAD